MSGMSNPTQEAVVAALLRRNFLVFFEKAFRELNPNTPLDHNWHHEAIRHVLAECESGRSKRLLINIPPRSLKTLLISVAWVAFLLGKNPALRILCVSYADGLVEEQSLLCRKVMRSEWYKALFPGTRLDRDTARELRTTIGGYRMAVPIQGALTGRGGDIIILDDPMKPEDAYSETERENVRRYFSGTLTTRLDNKLTGIIVVVMQRLHEDDLSGHLIQQGDWHLLRLPAIAIDDEQIPIGADQTHKRATGDLLHAAREPKSVLDAQKRDMGSMAFEAQYQQDPAPAAGNMLRRDWLRYYDGYSLPAREQGEVYQSWDTAMKGDPACDYSCCTTWFRHEANEYLLEVFRGKLDFPDLKKKALELFEAHRPDAILIENKASGLSLAQELRVPPNCLTVIERSPERDKISRFSAVLPVFEAGQVYLLKRAPWLHEYEKELLGFSAAKHDDQVDSTSQYLGWRNERRTQRFDCFWT